jgi:hypothetical protein
MRVDLIIGLAVAITMAQARPVLAQEEPTAVDYNRDVRPILSNHCYHCHGPDAGSRQADLRLDTPDGARAALVAENGLSKLIARVESSDPFEIMPPPEAKKPLSAQQIEVLRRWVAADAPWGQHWAFEPLVAPDVPGVASTPDRPLRNPIDHFIQARLAKHGLEAAEQANRETLIRRVTLDLTGLPPTPREVDDFLSDPSDDAYERVVDRLLASPAYGERMAWNWLDAARYADSNGYQGDGERTMWPWRDWVIRAFNENLPYHDFTTWQLAGDLLPDATFEQKLATGFCRNHMINGEGGRIPEENRVDYVMDMSETTGTVWLGLTMNCCRCHDHKFDPLKQSDYFRLFAFFNQTPVNGGGGNPQTPPILAAPTDEQRQRIDGWESQLQGIRDEIQTRTQELVSLQAAWEQARLSLGSESPWQVIVPTALEAKHQKLEVLDDGSVFASGENPANDDYTLQYQLDAGQIASLKIEAIRDERHTQGGLARSNSGNFVLTEIELSIRQPDEQQPRDIPIERGKATFEQGGFPIHQAFDGNQTSGWAVYSGRPVDRDHAAAFRLKKPVTVKSGSVLTVVLRHQSPHVSHNLGRFRVAISEQLETPLEARDDQLLAALRKSPDERTDDERKLLKEAHQSSDARWKALQDRREETERLLKKERDSVAQVMVMADQSEPRRTHILGRGLYNKPGDVVTAGVPERLPQLPANQPANRLALARWIVSEANPLAARVTVNRFWQQFFGVGLVKTTEDFGVQGEIPIHQDLLDWLASDFRAHRGDVKRLVRQIVTSHAYRQSSRLNPELLEKDPENRLLARGARFRMPSWMIRDQALAASGLLVQKIGGPPVRGYQPEGVWEEATFGKKRYIQDQGDALYRRSLYTFWRRIIAPTMFFDNASRQTCTVKVLRTNTPLHALLTLNDVTFVEASRALAQLVLIEPESNDRQRLDAIYRRILSRRPTPAEQAILLNALERSRREFAERAEAAQQLLSIGDSPRNENLDAVEHAAWTSLVLAVFNLDETLTKE